MPGCAKFTSTRRVVFHVLLFEPSDVPLDTVGFHCKVVNRSVFIRSRPGPLDGLSRECHKSSVNTPVSAGALRSNSFLKRATTSSNWYGLSLIFAMSAALSMPLLRDPFARNVETSDNNCP